MLINADVGESDAENETDLQLLQHVDIVNIALGAHAGDPKWSRQLCVLAIDAGKQVSLHPGYPDRPGFGRREMPLSWDSLQASLNQQRDVLPKITCCKFHGAIYNRAVIDNAFADQLAAWCDDSGITTLLTPEKSCLADAAAKHGIAVLREGFADRRYVLRDQRLTLAPRDQLGAVMPDTETALNQAIAITDDSRVRDLAGTWHSLTCDTLCLHGDSAYAIELARRLHQWNRLR